MRRFLIALFGCLLLGNGASAATFEVNAFARGCLYSNGDYGCGFSGTGTGTYYTGNSLGQNLRAFLVFDLSGVTGTIVSASFSFLDNSDFAYNSADATEAVGFFRLGANTVAEVLTNTGDANTYSALGTGTNLGYPSFSAAMTSGDVSHSLSASWIAELNEGGTFGVGMNFITLAGSSEEGVFGASMHSAVKLTLETGSISTVPVPASLPLLLAGVGGIALMRRGARR